RVLFRSYGSHVVFHSHGSFSSSDIPVVVGDSKNNCIVSNIRTFKPVNIQTKLRDPTGISRTIVDHITSNGNSSILIQFNSDVLSRSYSSDLVFHSHGSFR